MGSQEMPTHFISGKFVNILIDRKDLVLHLSLSQFAFALSIINHCISIDAVRPLMLVTSPVISHNMIPAKPHCSYISISMVLGVCVRACDGVTNYTQIKEKQCAQVY